MWKRDDAAKPAGTPVETGTAGGAVPSGAGTRAAAETRRPPMRDGWSVGKSVVITGELNGNEDVFVEGQVDGTIELRHHVLTVGPNGKIKAQVFARQVVVLGEVVGNITASEKVAIRDDGAVDGDLIAPRVAIAEGANFRGSIDMQRQSGASGASGGASKSEATAATDGRATGAPRS